MGILLNIMTEHFQNFHGVLPPRERLFKVPNRGPFFLYASHRSCVWVEMCVKQDLLSPVRSIERDTWTL